MPPHPPRFTWDPAKDDANARRHGIRFADAARIFDGPTLERVDDRFNYGETRIYAIGLVSDVAVTVIYTDRGEDEYRMIAAWRAEPHERRSYWQNLSADGKDGLETRSRTIRRSRASRAARRPGGSTDR